jgi:hypothetical protein
MKNKKNDYEFWFGMHLGGSGRDLFKTVVPKFTEHRGRVVRVSDPYSRCPGIDSLPIGGYPDYPQSLDKTTTKFLKIRSIHFIPHTYQFTS